MDSLPFTSVAACRTLWPVLVFLLLTVVAGLAPSGAAPSTEGDVKHAFRLPHHGKDGLSFVTNDQSLRFRPTTLRNDMSGLQSIAASNWVARPPLLAGPERDCLVLSLKDQVPVEENFDPKLLSSIAIQRSWSHEWEKSPSNIDDEVKASGIDEQLPFAHGIWESVPDPFEPVLEPPSEPSCASHLNLNTSTFNPPVEKLVKLDSELSTRSSSPSEPRKRARRKRSPPREKPSLAICSHYGCRRRPSCAPCTSP